MDMLVVGNGQGFPISNTGSSIIHTPKQNIHLLDMLHVPHIKKKNYSLLLS